MKIQFSQFLRLNDFLEDSRSQLTDCICLLCQGVYYQPVLATCGHVFCSGCVNKLAEKNDRCPHPLHSSFTFSSNSVFTRVLPVEKAIGKFKMNCRNKEYGCSWIGEAQDLAFHIENECEHVHVKCTYEQCEAYISKKEYEKHLAICKYRISTCKYCNNNYFESELVSHMNKCEKIPISCSLCGELIEKRNVKSHQEHFCLVSEIKCPYSVMGCDYVSSRKNMSEHTKENVDKHNFYLYEMMIQNNKQILETRKSLFRIEKILSNIPKNLPFIDESAKGNLRRKRKRKELSFSEDYSLSSSESEDNQISCSDNNENPSVITSLVISDMDSVTHPRKRQLPSGLLARPAKKVQAKSISIDTVDIPKGIEVKFNTAKVISKSKSEHKYVMTNTILNSTTTEWLVKIKRISGWMGFGACLKQLVISNKFKFSDSRLNFDHGTYLISSNGYAWNPSNPEQDCKKIENFPTINTGDVISFSFKDAQEELEVRIGEFKYILRDVVYPKGIFLVPCVVLMFDGDEIAFNELNVISDES